MSEPSLLSEGVQDEILTRLAKLADLKAISRSPETQCAARKAYQLFSARAPAGRAAPAVTRSSSTLS
jgi:TolB-like protein